MTRSAHTPLLLGALLLALAPACSESTSPPANADSGGTTGRDASVTADGGTATPDAGPGADASAGDDASTGGDAGSGAPDAGTTPDGGPNITWSACTPPSAFECGTLTVPISYADPSLGTLDVKVTRQRAYSTTERLGALFFAAGGPGQSGIDFARGTAGSLPYAELARRFDLVSMDVRGTGATGPILQCVDDATRVMLQTAAGSAVSDAELFAIYQSAVDLCATPEHLPYLAHLDTGSVARDIDLFRQALGEEALSLYGGSYGTWVLAEYGARFPTHVRAAVLMSALNGSTDLFERQRWTTFSADRALKAFFTWCDGDASCAFRVEGGSSQAAFLDLTTRLDAAPLTDTVMGRTRTLDGRTTALALFNALYFPDYVQIGAALAAVRDGQPGAVLDAIDQQLATVGGWGDSPLVITTLDAPAAAGVTMDDWRSYWETTIVPESDLWSRFEGARSFSVWLGINYPYRADEPLTSLAAPSAPPFLFLGGTHDPATSIEGARTMVAALNNGSVMIESERIGHDPSSPCTRTRMFAYLADPTAPVDTSRCPYTPPAAPAVDETVTATATAQLVRSREALRIGEDPLGNLVADAMLAAGAPLGAQVALMNSGGIQSSIPSDYQVTSPGLRRPPASPPYDVVVQDARRVLRFGNRLAVTHVTGAALRAFLEHSLSGWTADGNGRDSGRFVQVAGVHFAFDGTAPAGQRLSRLTLSDGAAVSDTGTYLVAVPDFVLYGGTGSLALAESTPVIGDTLDDVLVSYLRARGTIMPYVDGRIARIAP